MKRYIIVLSLVLGAVFTIVPSDIEVMRNVPEDVVIDPRADITYGKRIGDVGQAAYDVAAAKAGALKEAGKSAARTGWRGFVGTGVPFATTYDVKTVEPARTETKYIMPSYRERLADRDRLMQEVYGGYVGPEEQVVEVQTPAKRIARLRNVTIGEAGEAAADLADRGYYGAMAGLGAGVGAVGSGARALGRGAQAGIGAAGRGVASGARAAYGMGAEGLGAAGRGVQRGWRGFVDTGVPLTGVTEYSMSPYEMDESMGGYFAPRRQVATQRRRTFGEVGEAIRGGAEAGYGAARRVAGAGYGKAATGARAAYGMGARGLGAVGRGTQAGWNRFLNVGVPGTTETEYKVISGETPYSFGEWMGTSPVERRRTVGEVGAGIGGAAARGARAGWRGVTNIPVLGTTATEYSMSPYEMSEAYGGYFAPRQQIKTERRKTLGEKAGEWYGAIKDKFSTKK